MGWRMVAPGADGVEVGEEVGGEMGCEGFAAELGGELGGEILEHGEGDEEGVAGCPRDWLVVEDVELYGEVAGAYGQIDGVVDATGVGFELVELVGCKDDDGAVGCRAKLQDALATVVVDESGSEYLSELTCGVAAQDIHLP